VVNGDPRAATYFVDRFTPLVFGVLRRERGLSHEDAEDLYQQLFLRLYEDDWRRLRLWRGDGELASYLVPIVRNLVHEHRRKEGREPAAAGDDDTGFDRLLDDEPTAEEQASLEEQRSVLKECLQELPPQQRELYALRYEQDRMHREIARRLELTTNSVSVALHRLDRRLRDCCERRRKTRDYRNRWS